MATPQQTVARLKELVKDANELVGQGEREYSDWEMVAPKCQGWITSATANFKAISDQCDRTQLYYRHIEKIAGEAERNSLDSAVRDIADILQRFLKDAEDGLIYQLG